MTGAFERATAVQRANGDRPDRPDRFAAEIADGWDIAGNANGGYLLAVAAQAVADEDGRRPLTITAHYLAPRPRRCAFRSRFLHGGLLVEDGEVWDTAGNLVAQSSQLALIPR